jgi:hypothetical protein
MIETILSNSVTAIVTAIAVPALLSRIPKVRDWFKAEPWRLATAMGAIAAFLVSIAMGTIKPVPSDSLPDGLVIASLKPCNTLGDHWTLFKEAGGRFIIGAGTHDQSDVATKSYTPFSVPPINPQAGFEGPLGGEEAHTLLPEEMPRHSHDLSLALRWGDKTGDIPPGWGNDNGVNGIKSVTTTTFGGQADGSTKPHNNIPPYVALFFCEKN